jgi:hypothetical protein
VEVNLCCSGIRLGMRGGFGVDVLVAAKPANEYTRLGVNLSAAVNAPPTAYVDTSQTAAGGGNQSEFHQPNTNIVSLWQLHSQTDLKASENVIEHQQMRSSSRQMSSSINITVLVDVSADHPYSALSDLRSGFRPLSHPLHHSDGLFLEFIRR